jgi:hypothetical protein
MRMFRPNRKERFFLAFTGSLSRDHGVDTPAVSRDELGV